MHHLSVRAESTQQLGEFPVGFPIRHQAFFASETTPDSPQYEEGLVGRTLSFGTPDLELAEAFQEVS